MMNKYPLWKNILIAVVLLVAAVSALPNLYGEDPAVQVSSTRGAEVGESTLIRVKGVLDRAAISYKSAAQIKTGLLVRFNDTDAQLKAQDLIKQDLGEDYVAALNLAPATPAWLQAINAAPMYLGLDLRGGVHFLMEVDMDAVAAQAYERYVDDLRAALRNEKIRYASIERRQLAGVDLKFQGGDERVAAIKLVKKDYPELTVAEEERDGAYYLFVSLNEVQLRETRKSAVSQNITTLRNRVNELGVAEPVIQQQGESRVVVQLPGVQDTARAKEILGATATLEFKLVDDKHSITEAMEGRVPPGSRLYRNRTGGNLLIQNRTIVTGESVIDAASGIDQSTGGAAVFITLDGKGAKLMNNVTRENVGKQMAVVFIENKTESRTVNGEVVRTKKKVEEVINAATIREALSKRFQITGLSSPDEARNLALLLRAGALRAPMEIVEERTVGPSLGAENIAKGFRSNVLGFAAIALFMVFYYRVFGLIATTALAVNIVLLVAVLSMLQATLTLPGIAGIALTVGMAIDANVLISERIREELRNGNTPQAAIHAGYERAWGTILDSNVTTFIAGFALFLLGSGPVRGFAVVLCLGILTSMFSAVLVSRALVNLTHGQRKLSKLMI